MDQGKFTVQILKINKFAHSLIRDSAEYRSLFNEWRNQRVDTSRVIEDLGKKIDKVHLTSNVMKGAGAAVSVAGGLASLAGIVLAVTGHANSAKMIQKGNIAQIIGTLTTASATLTELGLTKNVQNDIKQVLDKDMELTKNIDKYVQRSLTLDSLTRDIFGCGIESKLLTDVLKICSDITILVSAASSTWDELVPTIQKHLMCSNASELPDNICEIVLNIARRIFHNRRLIEPVINICNTLTNNDNLREMSNLGLKLHYMMQTMFKHDLILNILTAFGLPSALYSSTTCRVTCDIIGIALNTVSVIFAVDNIKKGSPYSQKLKDLGHLLTEELVAFDAEFDEYRAKGKHLF